MKKNENEWKRMLRDINIDGDACDESHVFVMIH